MKFRMAVQKTNILISKYLSTKLKQLSVLCIPYLSTPLMYTLSPTWGWECGEGADRAASKHPDGRAANHIIQNICLNNTNCILTSAQHLRRLAEILIINIHPFKQQAKFILFSPDMGALKTLYDCMWYCGVLKTTPNILPSHVGCDTSAEVCDTSAVDLENSY